MELTALPLTAALWTDLEAIFNAKGCSVARGCWCMAYRRSGPHVAPPPNTTRGEVNKLLLKTLVDGGHSPGLIGYCGNLPVGWVSIGPREEYSKLSRSPIMKPIDDQQVWSIVCFVVPKQHRGRGVARALLTEAVDYARKHGATVIEAYPVDKTSRSRDDSMWFGAKTMYDKAGFREMVRRKPHRPVMRLIME